MKFSTVITKYINTKYTILALLFLGIMCIVVPSSIQYRLYLSYFFLLLFLIFTILGYRPNKITITGEMRFEDGFINILDIDNKIINKLSLKVVDEIILKYSAFKGELPVGSLKNFIPSQGAENKIIIKSQNDVYKYNLYLENQPDAIRFKMLYRFLKENDIKTKLKGL